MNNDQCATPACQPVVGNALEWRVPKVETFPFIPLLSDHSSSSGSSGQMRTVRRHNRRPRDTLDRGSGGAQPPMKRKKSSDKEKLRNMEIKKALCTLSKSMPFVNRHKELSRIRTLRLAKEYIIHLRRILDGEMIYCENSGKLRPLRESDFERIVDRELQTNNSYKDRAEKEIGSEHHRQVTPPIHLESPPNEWLRIALDAVGGNDAHQLPHANNTTLDGRSFEMYSAETDGKYHHCATLGFGIDSYGSGL